MLYYCNYWSLCRCNISVVISKHVGQFAYVAPAAASHCISIPKSKFLAFLQNIPLHTRGNALYTMAIKDKTPNHLTFPRHTQKTPKPISQAYQNWKKAICGTQGSAAFVGFPYIYIASTHNKTDALSYLLAVISFSYSALSPLISHHCARGVDNKRSAAEQKERKLLRLLNCSRSHGTISRHGGRIERREASTGNYGVMCGRTGCFREAWKHSSPAPTWERDRAAHNSGVPSALALPPQLARSV